MYDSENRPLEFGRPMTPVRTYHTAGDAIPDSISGHVCTYKHHPIFVGSIHLTTMSGCTLRFTRDSPLRTTLVDEATGHVRYQIDTPMRITERVTRIRKFESSTQPPIHRENNPDIGYDDDITDKERKKKKACDDITDMGRKKKSLSDTTSGGKRKKAKKDENAEKEAEVELTGTGDEVARICWKWFSSDRIIFRGRIHHRTQFLPRCGKMKG